MYPALCEKVKETWKYDEYAKKTVCLRDLLFVVFCWTLTVSDGKTITFVAQDVYHLNIYHDMINFKRLRNILLCFWSDVMIHMCTTTNE